MRRLEYQFQSTWFDLTPRTARRPHTRAAAALGSWPGRPPRREPSAPVRAMSPPDRVGPRRSGQHARAEMVSPHKVAPR